MLEAQRERVGVAELTPGEHRGEHAVFVDHEPDHHALDGGSPQRMASKRRTHDLHARFPLLQPIRTSANVLRGPERATQETFSGGLTLLQLRERRLEQVAGQGVKVAKAEDARVRVQRPPHDDHRAWIRREHALDRTLRGPDKHAEIRVPVHPQGECEVLRRQRRAVVPGQSGPQLVGRLHPSVREDAPGVRVELGKRLREIRKRRPARVELDQGSVEKPSRRERTVAAEHLGGEVGWFVPMCDDEGLARPRLLLVPARGRLALSRAAAHEQRGQQHADKLCTSWSSHS